MHATIHIILIIVKGLLLVALSPLRLISLAAKVAWYHIREGWDYFQ